MAWCTYPRMKLWFIDKSPFTSYTTLTSYVTSHVQYTKIIAMCIECATALWANNTRVTCKVKARLAIYT